MERKLTTVLLLFLLCLDHIAIGKRGGGGFGRGSSGSRSGGGGLFSSGRGNSGARTGGSSYGSVGPSKQQHSGGHGSQGWSGNKASGHSVGGNWRNSMYNKGAGVGSSSRSSLFKNMIVGAAAGYLTYQAGKYLIRNLASPMMWGGRPYYWGSSYYQSRPGYSTMCRMPFNDNDPTFGNIYTSDYSRPKELVWSCLADEECCGNECCPRSYGYGGGYGSGYRAPGVGLWFLLLLLLLCCCCGGLIIYNLFKKGHFGNKYSSGTQGMEGTFTYPNAPPAYC